MNFLYKFALLDLNRVIFLNKDDSEQFIAGGIISRPQSFVLGAIGVDLDYFSPPDLPVSAPVFTMIARLVREKGVEDFLNAARIVKAQYPDAFFYLLGGLDDQKKSFTNYDLCRWKSEGIVSFPGHVNVKHFLYQTGVFVLPSYYREGVPRSIQEAMAVGLPVITTDVPGCRDTVVDGLNGFLVPAHNPVSLAQAMIKFIISPEMIVKMGRESRRIASLRYNVHEVNQRLCSLIDL
ncbi:putative alpha-galactosyltransferase [Synechococcus sp. RS9909]|nr:putative alpha-galactosyltransferase [Synechococcus sp. RS9909]